MNAISQILNIQVTRKNKNIDKIDIHNPLMAGFPSIALTKHRDKLLSEGYTIVLIEQVTSPPNPEDKLLKFVVLEQLLKLSIPTIQIILFLFISKNTREEMIHFIF